MVDRPNAKLEVSRATTVFAQQVRAEVTDGFLERQREIKKAAECFAGYRGTYVYPPDVLEVDPWAVAIHFDDSSTLQGWLDSHEHAHCMADLRRTIGQFEFRTLEGGLGAWFVAVPSAAPAGWKLVLSVLLGLFPTVMLLTVFTGPLTSLLGLSISMLVGNALSVSILDWALRPPLTRTFRPWLQTRDIVWPALQVVVTSVAALAIPFRQVTG